MNKDRRKKLCGFILLFSGLFAFWIGGTFITRAISGNPSLGWEPLDFLGTEKTLGIWGRIGYGIFGAFIVYLGFLWAGFDIAVRLWDRKLKQLPPEVAEKERIKARRWIKKERDDFLNSINPFKSKKKEV
jgi:uncharacterized protein YneF (UPF0154 family)